MPGCGKHPDAAAPVSAQPAAPPNPAAAPANPEPAPTKLASAPSNPGKDLAELTMAVKAYYLAEAKRPTSLDDLVKARCIYKLPTPPPGKKYVIDTKKLEAVLVTQ